MPVAFLFPNTFFNARHASGSLADVDEGIAAADGDVITTDPDDTNGLPILRFFFDNLPAEANTINSVILRVRSRIDNFVDDTTTYIFDDSIGGLGSGSITYDETDSSLVTREVDLTGGTTVVDVNNASIRWQQTAWNQVMNKDGLTASVDCIELEVDYNIVGGATIHLPIFPTRTNILLRM